MEVDFNTTLAFAFGLWAAVVGWLGRQVIRRMDAIAASLEKESERLQQYIVQTETRLAVLENINKIG